MRNEKEIREKYGRDCELALTSHGIATRGDQLSTVDVRGASSTLADFVTSANVFDGVVRWDSNGQIPPRDILALWDSHDLPFDYGDTLATYETELTASLAAYRANQPATPSAEELSEMRAAFGPGVEVVDAISGRRVTT